MSVPVVNSHINPNGELCIGYHVGRMTSKWLNIISYAGRVDWTPAETALSATATVVVFLDGVQLDSQVITVQTDANRCVRSIVIPKAMRTVGDHVARVTSSANADIENDITFNVRVSSPDDYRVVGTSCYLTFNRGLWNGVDLGTGDADDNMVVLNQEPVNGHAATLSRAIIAENAALHVHIGDSTYPSFPNTEFASGTPLSLTDTGNDDPATPDKPRSDYAASITNASPLRTASLANQSFYIWHENYWRLPEIQAMCRAGHQHVKTPDDNDCKNDWDWTWWSCKYTNATTGMTADAGNPYTDPAIDPTADPNFDTLQQETLDFYRVFRTVWQMYAADWSPPLDGSVSAEPWVMRQATTDAVAADFVPFSWVLENSTTKIIAKDFMTCGAITPIATNNFIKLTVDENFYDFNGFPVAVESPLGAANDASFKLDITKGGQDGKNVLLCLNKELGAMGNGNLDAVYVKTPNWSRDLLNTFFPSLSFSVVGLGGDWHRPTVWKIPGFIQFGVSPFANAVDSAETTPLFNDFKPTGINNVDELLLTPTFTYNATSTSRDNQRLSYGAVVSTPKAMHAYAKDNQGGLVSLVYKIDNSGITAVVGSALPTPEELNVALKKFTVRAGTILNEGGPNNPSMSYLSPIVQGQAFGGGAGTGSLALIDTETDVIEGTCVSISERRLGNNLKREIVFDASNSNSIADDAIIESTLPMGATFTVRDPVTDATVVLGDLTGHTKSEEEFPMPEAVAYLLELSAYSLVAANCAVNALLKSSNPTSTSVRVTAGNAVGDSMDDHDTAVGDVIVHLPTGATQFDQWDIRTITALSTAVAANDTADFVDPGIAIASARALIIMSPDYVWTADATVGTQSGGTLTQSTKSIPQAIIDACNARRMEFWVPNTGFRAQITSATANTFTWQVLSSPAWRATPVDASNAFVTAELDVELGEWGLLLPIVDIDVVYDDPGMGAVSVSQATHTLAQGGNTYSLDGTFVGQWMNPASPDVDRVAFSSVTVSGGVVTAFAGEALGSFVGVEGTLTLHDDSGQQAATIDTVTLTPV